MNRRRPSDLAHASIGGESVRLRPQSPRDVDRAFHLIEGNEAILRWLLWEGPVHRSDLEDHYGRWIVPSEQGSNYYFAIADRSTDEFLGAMGLRFAGHPASGDLGYWLGSPFQGRGIGSEAVRLATWLGFRHLGAEVLCAWVFVGNGPSRAVLERSGYRLVRTARGAAQKRGRPVDEWYLAQTRAEWERALGDWRPVEDEVSFGSTSSSSSSRAGRRSGIGPDRDPLRRDP